MKTEACGTVRWSLTYFHLQPSSQRLGPLSKSDAEFVDVLRSNS